MNIRNLFALSLVVALTPAIVHAHGLQMTFHVNSAGNFESDSKAYYGPVPDPIDHHDSVFLSGSYTITSLNGSAIPSTSSPSLQFTASPSTSNPPATNGLAIGSTYGFDLVGPLLFWDPVLGVTPTNVTATVVRSGNGFTVDKNTSFVSGGNLTTLAGPYNGTTGFHNSTTVNIPVGSPVGLYVIGYDIRSTNATTYGTSNVFYAIGTNGLSDADFYRGVDALRAIGVPEPSTVALLGIGAVGMGVQGWRRHRQLRRKV